MSPCMSYSPYGFGCFRPTTWLEPFGNPPVFPQYQTYGFAAALAVHPSLPSSASPNENRLSAPPRAALSHSASVGSLAGLGAAPPGPLLRSAFRRSLNPPGPAMSFHEMQ